MTKDKKKGFMQRAGKWLDGNVPYIDKIIKSIVKAFHYDSHEKH